MLKITALNVEDFELIKKALEEADPTSDFLQFFDKVEQIEHKDDKKVVLLKNKFKFVKDLNKNKYIVSLPDKFVIDGFECVDDFEFVGRHRVPFVNTVICTHIEGYDIKFVIVLTGFASHNVKVIHSSDAICTYYNGCLCGNGTTAVNDFLEEPTLTEAIEEALK